MNFLKNQGTRNDTGTKIKTGPRPIIGTRNDRDRDQYQSSGPVMTGTGTGTGPSPGPGPGTGSVPSPEMFSGGTVMLYCNTVVQLCCLESRIFS